MNARESNKAPRWTPPLGMARVREILARLARAFPNATTELEHRSPWELLVATLLSAQSTDKGVNRETPALFEAYPDVYAMAQATPEQLEPFLARLGLYRNKARALAASARRVVSEFGGEVPRTREALMSLPGVGRKTANVVLSCAFGVPALAVDTHVFRVANRLELARASSVEEVEQQLMQVIPERDWSEAHHWLILQGRRVCTARNPRCKTCELADLCPSSSVQSARAEADAAELS